MNTFPQPIRLTDDDGKRERPNGTQVPRKSGSSRWRLSEIMRYEAERAGTPVPHLEPQAERYLSARAVAERLDVSVSTVWRWTTESARAARDEAA